jgi:hypothetical protein
VVKKEEEKRREKRKEKHSLSSQELHGTTIT